MKLHKDGLYVNWHLLDGLNHDTEYSHEPPSVATEQYVREPLLETAYNLLSQNRPEYLFHLYGGEPTVHPYFPELFKYIHTSGRNVHIILDTNGIRSEKFYFGLLRNTLKKRICVNLEVHLNCIELQQLLTILALIVENGQFCKVILNHVPQYANKSMLFCQKLAEFRKLLPFQMEFRFPLGNESSLASLQQYFADTSLVLPDWPEWAEPFVKEDSAEDSSGLVFIEEENCICAGTNCLQVEMDGKCTLGLLEDDKTFQPVILDKGEIFRDGFPPRPSFADKEDAEQWLKDFNLRLIHYEIEGGPVRHPFLQDVSEEQNMLFSLMKLRPVSARAKYKMGLYPELWLEHKKDILKGYEIFEDKNSRDTFLRLVKAQLYGNSAYCAKPDYAKFAHPELAEKDGFTPVPNAEDCRLIRLDKDVTFETFEGYLPRIDWYAPALELVLPDNKWLQLLLAVHKVLPEYKFFLGQHGAGQTVLYAKPKQRRKHYRPIPLRTMDGVPLVSVILPVAEDADKLSTSLESILAQKLPRCEIVAVKGSEYNMASEVLDEFIRQEPWKIRAYNLASDTNLNGAWDAGLDMAQGEYVCFLKPGDILAQDALPLSVQEMEKTKADLAIATHDTDNMQELAGSVAWSHFLNGKLGNSGLRNKLYRASLIREHALAIDKLEGDIEDALFNLTALYFSGTIVQMTGSLINSEEDTSNFYEENAQDQLKGFLHGLLNLARFCKAHNLDLKDSEIRSYCARTFTELLQKIKWELILPDQPEDLFTPAVVAIMRATGLVTEILTDLCRLESSDSQQTMPKQPCIATEPIAYDLLSKKCELIVGNSVFGEDSYLLSLCVLIQREQDLNFFDNLNELDLLGFELLAFDLCTDPELSDKLNIYATIYPNLKVLRVQANITENQTIRLLLDHAKGQFIGFCNPELPLNTEYLNFAMSALATAKQNLIFVDATSAYTSFSGEEISNEERRIALLQGLFEPENNNVKLENLFIAVKFLQNNKLWPDTAGCKWQTMWLFRILSLCTISILQTNVNLLSDNCLYTEDNNDFTMPVSLTTLDSLTEEYNILTSFVEKDALIDGLRNYLENSVKELFIPTYKQLHQMGLLKQDTLETLASKLPDKIIMILFQELLEHRADEEKI